MRKRATAFSLGNKERLRIQSKLQSTGRWRTVRQQTDLHRSVSVLLSEGVGLWEHRSSPDPDQPDQGPENLLSGS